MCQWIKIMVVAGLIACLPPVLQAQSRTDFKPELKKLTDDLVMQIKGREHKKVAVANFVDLQNNVTELGRYLAQQFSVNLVKSQMDVIDRSRIDMLMQENNMSSRGLLDPKNQAKLGELAGIDIIITGTTSPIDNTVELTISAIDLKRGTNCAATSGSIPRTEAINTLLRNPVGDGGNSGSSVKSPFVGDAPGKNQDPSETFIGDRIFDLPKEQCAKGSYIFGQVYFENTLKEDLVLYYANGLYHYNKEIKIASGTKNASQLLYTDYAGKTNSASEYVFMFHTAEEEEADWRYGTLSVVVNGCKVKVHAINSNRIFLKKKR